MGPQGGKAPRSLSEQREMRGRDESLPRDANHSVLVLQNTPGAAWMRPDREGLGGLHRAEGVFQIYRAAV
jgi:hypothetical protein